MKIRKAKIEDIEIIEALAEDKGKEYFRRIIKSKNGICFVAEECGIAGIVYGEKNKKEGWSDLRGIMVVKGWRDIGIGTALIKRFLEESTGEVEVFYKGETRIINKLGFENMGSYQLWIRP